MIRTVNKSKLLWPAGAKKKALIENTNSFSQHTARHGLIDFYHFAPLFLTMSCCFHTVITFGGGLWKSVSRGFGQAARAWRTTPDLTQWAANSCSAMGGGASHLPTACPHGVRSHTACPLISGRMFALTGRKIGFFREEIRQVKGKSNMVGQYTTSHTKDSMLMLLSQKSINPLHSDTLLNLNHTRHENLGHLMYFIWIKLSWHCCANAKGD